MDAVLKAGARVRALLIMQSRRAFRRAGEGVGGHFVRCGVGIAAACGPSDSALGNLPRKRCIKSPKDVMEQIA